MIFSSIAISFEGEMGLLRPGKQAKIDNELNYYNRLPRSDPDFSSFLDTIAIP